MSKARRVFSVTVAALALQASWALAQDEQKPLGPCKADIQKLCNDVKPGGGRIIQCMKEHDSELSDACRAAIQKRRGQRKAPSAPDAGN